MMERLLKVLATLYDHERDLPEFSAPRWGDRSYRTFWARTPRLPTPCDVERFAIS